MKKIIAITIIAFITTSLIFVSCKKNEPTTQNKTTTKLSRSEVLSINNINSKIINGVLTFESIEDYKSIYDVNNYSDILTFANLVNSTEGFTSLYSIIENTETKNQYEFLGKLLNQNSVIKIGEFLILIDFASGKVFAKTDATEVELISAKNGNSNNSVQTFDINEDVVEELQFKKTRGLFCSARWCGNPPNGQSINTNMTSVQQVNPADPSLGFVTLPVIINGFTKYWAAGIYFELNSRIVVTPAGSPLATAPFSYQTTYTAKRRCGNNVGSSSSSSFTNASNDKTIMYWNVRALSKYNITETFSSSASVPSGVVKTINVIDQ
jgi:hypothetical protein